MSDITEACAREQAGLKDRIKVAEHDYHLTILNIKKTLLCFGTVDTNDAQLLMHKQSAMIMAHNLESFALRIRDRQILLYQGALVLSLQENRQE